MKRDGVVDDLKGPVGGTERRDDFPAATAAAAMNGGAITLRDVQDAVFKLLGDELDKLRPENGLSHAGAVSSRVSWCALMA